MMAVIVSSQPFDSTHENNEIRIVNLRILWIRHVEVAISTLGSRILSHPIEPSAMIDNECELTAHGVMIHDFIIY